MNFIIFLITEQNVFITSYFKQDMISNAYRFIKYDMSSPP